MERIKHEQLNVLHLVSAISAQSSCIIGLLQTCPQPTWWPPTNAWSPFLAWCATAPTPPDQMHQRAGYDTNPEHPRDGCEFFDLAASDKPGMEMQDHKQELEKGAVITFDIAVQTVGEVEEVVSNSIYDILDELALDDGAGFTGCADKEDEYEKEILSTTGIWETLTKDGVQDEGEQEGLTGEIQQKDVVNGASVQKEGVKVEIFQKFGPQDSRQMAPVGAKSTQTNAMPRLRKHRCHGKAIQTETIPNPECSEVGVQADDTKTSSIFVHEDTDQDVREFLALEKGTWEPLDDIPKTLQVGDMIEITCDTKSTNPIIKLTKGQRGCVRRIDADGDPMIYFPHAPYHFLGEHWINHKACCTLSPKQDA